MTVALFTAAVALVSGLITASITGWLASRAKVSEELRELRLSLYPALWKRTSMLSRHPQTNATYADLERLHFDLRRWYYGLGGVALSTNTRDRFMDLQTLIGTHLAHDEASLEDELEPDSYEGLRELASAVRTGMTEDLESRRQRSLWWTIDRWLDHRKAKRVAARFQAAAAGTIVGGKPTRPERRRVRYELTEDDLRLDEPAPPTAS